MTDLSNTIQLFFASSGRMNFTQMARCSSSCVSRFCLNFNKPFEWLAFKRHFLSQMMGYCIVVGIDSFFISKASKKTLGVDWFWPGCAGDIKHGLEILVLPVVDADA